MGYYNPKKVYFWQLGKGTENNHILFSAAFPTHWKLVKLIFYEN
jgi:hypothetical protein